MKKISLFYTSILAFMLSSCGGGGGGGGASPAPVIPLAIINFSSSLSGEIDVGTEFTFSWTTTNASSELMPQNLSQRNLFSSTLSALKILDSMSQIWLWLTQFARNVKGKN